MPGENIIYEQPLNELVRVSLRLEHLFHQLNLCLHSQSANELVQLIVKSIIDILNVLNRPDIKSKLTKEFIRFLAYFARLKKMPGISHEKLDETTDKINYFLTHFLVIPGKIGHMLRVNEFIANMRQNLMSPGGDSCFNAPAYHYWLNQPAEVRVSQIKKWLSTFDEIKSAIELFLSIIRHASEPQTLTAEKGFYHEALDPNAPIQLIRVALDKTDVLYPEISAGRHRMSVRFVIPSIETRPRQTLNNIQFKLTLCKI